MASLNTMDSMDANVPGDAAPSKALEGRRREMPEKKRAHGTSSHRSPSHRSKKSKCRSRSSESALAQPKHNCICQLRSGWPEACDCCRTAIQMQKQTHAQRNSPPSKRIENEMFVEMKRRKRRTRRANAQNATVDRTKSRSHMVLKSRPEKNPQGNRRDKWEQHKRDSAPDEPLRKEIESLSTNQILGEMSLMRDVLRSRNVQ